MTAGSPPLRRSFVDVLRERASERPWLTPSNVLFEPLHVRRAVDEILRLSNRTVAPPPAHQLDEMLRALREAWRAQGTLGAISGRDLRRVPWVLFYPRISENWLAQDEPFLRVWLRWLAERENPRAVTALIREFLSVYPEELPAFEKLRTALQRQLQGAKSPRLVRWRERSETFGLLETKGPSRLVEGWPARTDTIDEYLDAAGLAGLEASAFVEKATAQLLDQTEKQLGGRGVSDSELARSLQWLEKEGKLRFESLKVQTATALLRPFVGRSPEPAVQEKIRSFLCRTIGDPRIRRPAWQGAPEEIRNVLFRWLVSLALDDFFRVFDEVAWKQHWEYRKAFWSAYLKKDAISDAWVVLGRDALERIRRASRTEAIAAASFRTGSDAHRSHSVLLMRIGGLNIAEWSHNGTCRIWREGSKKAPKLYEAKYSRSDLTTSASFSQPHHGSADGNWQYKIAAFVESETGIRLARSEYMPRKGASR